MTAKHSYGRQLGRITDVLGDLIEKWPGGAPDDPSVRQFAKMRDDIEKIKAKRIIQAISDLAEMKRRNPDECEGLALSSVKSSRLARSLALTGHGDSQFLCRSGESPAARYTGIISTPSRTDEDPRRPDKGRLSHDRVECVRHKLRARLLRRGWHHRGK